jgi:hypothetical protein
MAPSSVSNYVHNTVNIQHNESSAEAGDLDDSSALNIVSNNFKMYNVNVKNTYGKGAQACEDQETSKSHVLTRLVFHRLLP